MKPWFDYKGGSIVSAPFTSQNVEVHLCVSSVLSAFKDVIHNLGLENLYLKVNYVVTDMNAINSKAMGCFANL